MIPSEFMDELLARADVIDIIDKQVPLKKSGANCMACCPLHKEKTPSFSVSPSKQFYHCFSCGARGSAIGFVMKHQGLSFPEAVQYLADRVGMTMPQVCGRNNNPEVRAERKKEQQTLEETAAAATDFYAQQLKLNPAAEEYLDKRGLDAEIIAHYGLGYAPDGWQPLAQIFQPYPNTALVDSGMVIADGGRHCDRFRHRIMFPIRDPHGQVIGFSGHVSDNSKPKYLNSPDTPLSNRGKNPYGLYEGRATIKDASRTLMVEGYMDVVTLSQLNIGYSVAALGTTITAEHVKALMRQTGNVYSCFGSDSTGHKAVWHALENALSQLKDGKSLCFLFLPEEHDPDSYVRAYDKTQFEDALLHQSKPLSECFWDAPSDGLSLNMQEGKAELMGTSSPLLTQITAPALGFLLKQHLSELAGINPGNLTQLLGQETPKRHIKQKSYKLSAVSVKQPVMLTLVQQQIRNLLINPAWASYIDLPEYLPLTGDFAYLADLTEMIKNHPQPLNSAQILERMHGSSYETALNQVFQSTLNSSDEMESGNEEDCESFKIGMKKFLNELKYSQIELFKQRGSQSGLNNCEKQPLMSLLTSKASRPSSDRQYDTTYNPFPPNPKTKQAV